MNCLIYPFTSYHESLVDTINSTRKDIQVTVKVVPNGCAPALKEKGFEFTTDFNAALEKTEGVIICDCRNRKWLIKDIISKIKLALNSGKTVYNCTELKEEELEEIRSIPSFDSERFVNYGVYPSFDELESESYVAVDCPLIATGNMLKGLDDCTGLFELTKRFGEKGFKTVPIGTTFDCRLIGGYVFPANVFEIQMPEDDKIALFNTYVNDVQLMTGAEVIVLNIPDGFMKYSNEINEGCGIRPLMASAAVSVDFFIFNVPDEQVDAEMIPQLRNHIEQKYNLTIDVIAVDSKYVHYSDTIEAMTVTYVPLNDSKVDSSVAAFNEAQSDVPVIRLNNRDSYADVVSICMAKLS